MKLEQKWREGGHWRKRYEKLSPFKLKDAMKVKLKAILRPKPKGADAPKTSVGLAPPGSFSLASEPKNIGTIQDRKPRPK